MNRVSPTRPLAACLIASLMIAGWIVGSRPVRADETARSAKHQTIDVTYGVVLEIERIKLKSDAAKGAAVGGIVGVASADGGSSGDRVASAAAGALLGALITQAIEGHHKADAFTIRKTDGATINVIMDHADAIVGDCIAVEEGKYTNIRRVDGSLCKNLDLHEDEEIQASATDSAQECHQTKERLLEAESDEAFQRAVEKVKVLCH